ncbi:HNH/endonuclease VII fold putative polymorphic toxin [Streptomyces sp. NPDC058576]|uniref:HNH/endonuclease VII fold putative polymorphic toxin n=1 Tax=Streptomyces sp. NPDC058576 TaxID=3346547 RepID=UPI0036516277
MWTGSGVAREIRSRRLLLGFGVEIRRLPYDQSPDTVASPLWWEYGEFAPRVSFKELQPASWPYQGGGQRLDSSGRPIYYLEEWYELPNSDVVLFQHHHVGHQKPGEPGYQPAHVHARPWDATRHGQIQGAEEHYGYDLD